MFGNDPDKGLSYKAHWQDFVDLYQEAGIHLSKKTHYGRLFGSNRILCEGYVPECCTVVCVVCSQTALLYKTVHC